ncbi:MAG: GTP-binding protein [Pseudomonadota bacterium]
MKTRILILNGFLGSGKTTLFRNLLTQATRKAIPVCAIVNDMSELDIDGALISNTPSIDQDSRLFESIHACVLSSTQGLKKLDEALNRLLAAEQPELIIIETSGSAHPMPLVQYFEQHDRTRLIGVLAFVDSLMLAQDFDFGETLIPKLQQNLAQGRRDMINLLVEQILFSSHVMLTKADRIGDGQIETIAQHLHAINPYAPAYSIHFGNLPLESVFEFEDYDYFRVAQLVEELTPALAAEGDDERPFNLATRVIKDDRPFHPQRLWDACHQYLDQRIYRSKGFFWMASRDKHSLLWNQAAGGISLGLVGTWRASVVEDEDPGITPQEVAILKERLAKAPGRFGDRHCNLTVIGDEDQVDSFTDALRGCFLSEEEIERYRSGETFDDPWPQNIVKLRN